MSKLIFKVAAFSMLLFAAACTQQEPVLKKVNVAEAASLIDKESGLQIVDLRTPGEIAATGVIAGAKVIDISSPGAQKQLTQLDKNKPVLLYCATGMRSASAAQLLHKNKFLAVYDLSPGIVGWAAAGKTTTR